MQKNETDKSRNTFRFLIQYDRLKFFRNDLFVNEYVFTPGEIDEIDNMGYENIVLLLTNNLKEKFKDIPTVFIHGNQKI